MTALPPPRLYDPKADKWLLDSIAQLHIDCITQDHTLATFLPPLSHSKVLASWQVWSDQVENGSRVMMLQMAPAGSGDNPLPQHPSGEIILAGVVSLSFPDTETGSHRSEVGRLFTSPDFRRRGVARRLMVALEPIAVERERWLMVSPAATIPEVVHVI